MTKSLLMPSLQIAATGLLLLLAFSCKNKKQLRKQQDTVQAGPEDTIDVRCKLDFKSARTLSKLAKENEFQFDWLTAKANVATFIDNQDEKFDIRVYAKKDSAMLISIQYLLGLQVAKVLIRKDSVMFVNYIEKNYFKGDFNYINELLNADLDFEVVQAVLFGNSAEFHDDDSKLKPVVDRTHCHYLLSTVRKRKLRKLQTGSAEIKEALQTLTLKADNFKILANEFIEPSTNRTFVAAYSNFQQKDSVYAPYHVDIDIVAQKKANVKIDYVRIEKNTPQKLSLSIPGKYEPIQIQKK